MSRWLVIVVLVACSKPKAHEKPQPQVSACARVADHLVGLMSAATKHPPEATDPLRRVIGERCEKDAWSAETTSCLLAIENLSDGDRCQKLMTEVQVEAFHRDTEAATVELRGQFSEEPPGAQRAAPADAPTSD